MCVCVCAVCVCVCVCVMVCNKHQIEATVRPQCLRQRRRPHRPQKPPLSNSTRQRQRQRPRRTAEASPVKLDALAKAATATAMAEAHLSNSTRWQRQRRPRRWLKLTCHRSLSCQTRYDSDSADGHVGLLMPHLSNSTRWQRHSETPIDARRGQGHCQTEPHIFGELHKTHACAHAHATRRVQGHC